MYDELNGIESTRLLTGAGTRGEMGDLGRRQTWTFHIRHGVKWSDGQRSDREGRRLHVPAVDGRRDRERAVRQLPHHVTEVEATDDYTVVFTTSEPSAVDALMAMPILPEHIWNDVDGKEVATFANTDKPVGSGPFQLGRGPEGPVLPVRRQQELLGGAPKIDELVFRIFADDEAHGPGPEEGRDRHGAGHLGPGVRGARQHPRHHHERLEVLGLQRAGLQPRCRRPWTTRRSATATRR